MFFMLVSVYVTNQSVDHVNVDVYCVCRCFRTNETNSVEIPPVPEEVVVNGEQSDDEEEVPPSDDEEQEDTKDYCIGEY